MRLLEEAPSTSLERAAADAVASWSAPTARRPCGRRGSTSPARGIGDVTAEHPVALLLRGVRRPPLAARSTRAASARSPATSSRRPPTARCRWSPSACSTARATSASASTPAGWQHEYWVDTDPERLPAALVTGDDGAPLTITRPDRATGRSRRRSGASTSAASRSTCSTPSARRTRPRRPLDHRRASTSATATRASRSTSLLGIGGVRALAALGIEPGLVHLNEGHAAFAALELARARSAPARARPRARGRPPADVFTTHTPVPAGNDTYPAAQVDRRARRRIARASASTPSELSRLGRTDPATRPSRSASRQFALRTSRAANGVSRRHGEVAREMWQRPVARHGGRRTCRSPTSPTACTSRPGSARRCASCSTATSATDWLARATDPATWAPVDDIPDAELWAVRCAAARGARRVRARAQRRRPARARRAARLRRGRRRGVRPRRADDRLRPPAGDLQAAATCSSATPTRATAAARRRPARSSSCSPARRTRTTTGGKQLVAAALRLKRRAGDPATASSTSTTTTSPRRARLVRGCDVWLNLPRPPLEASGTSGMKSAVNGGLQLSVLDGWWAEGYDGTNGWALARRGRRRPRRAGRTAHAAELFRLLEEEVVADVLRARRRRHPARVARADPRARCGRSRRSFSAGADARDYERKVYEGPA